SPCWFPTWCRPPPASARFAMHADEPSIIVPRIPSKRASMTLSPSRAAARVGSRCGDAAAAAVDWAEGAGATLDAAVEIGECRRRRPAAGVEVDREQPAWGNRIRPRHHHTQRVVQIVDSHDRVGRPVLHAAADRGVVAAAGYADDVA